MTLLPYLSACIQFQLSLIVRRMKSKLTVHSCGRETFEATLSELHKVSVHKNHGKEFRDHTRESWPGSYIRDDIRKEKTETPSDLKTTNRRIVVRDSCSCYAKIHCIRKCPGEWFHLGFRLCPEGISIGTKNSLHFENSITKQTKHHKLV